MFELKASILEGCYEIQPKVFEDVRGRFVKVFHADAYAALGLETRFVEEYYSVSRQHVIRGLHFQTPPMDHVKLVYCIDGDVLDVVLDLRQGSPTFGRHALFDLSAAKANVVYIPKGVAHGFCVRSAQATLVYKVSTVYAPDQDSGILWNSADIPWPVAAPILSERDAAFPALDAFVSPFHDA